MIKVSILLPNLNNREFLDERMHSIINQTFENWELIIVDGYSTDGAWEFFQKCAKIDKRIKLYQSNIKGVYPNINKCVELSSGEYICIATSDDTMDLDFVKKMSEILDNESTCDIVHCKLNIIDEKGEPSNTKWDDFFLNKGYFGDLMDTHHIRQAPHDGLLYFSGITTYTSLNQLMFRKIIFDEIGLFSNEYGSFGDFEFGMKIGLTLNAYHIPEHLASWRIHENQATSQDNIFDSKANGVFLKMATEAVAFANRVNEDLLKDVDIEPLLNILKTEKEFYKIKKSKGICRKIKLIIFKIFKGNNNLIINENLLNRDYYPQDKILEVIGKIYKKADIKKRVKSEKKNTVIDETENKNLINYNYPPILIYQMGKVGSSTVLKSLKNNNLKNTIFHCHQLSNAGFERKISWLKYNNVTEIPKDMKFFMNLKKEIDKNRYKTKWHIISMTREPMQLELSGMFENRELFFKKNKVKTQKGIFNYIIDYFENMNVKNNYYHQWFDEELKDVFDIDIYSKPYDFDKGYSIIENNNVKVLVIRLEDLNKAFKNSMKEFLNISKIELIKDNLGKNKTYFDDYQYVMNNLAINKKLIKQIYNSKYSMHFYKQEEIVEYLKKWRKEGNS